MLGQSRPRIFISYSRQDGASFAAELRKNLEEENFSVWQDLVALEGGHDWWSQIEDALKSRALQHFILVITPGSLESPIVRREIRLARQEGKTFCPIKGPSLGNLAELPRWLGHIYDLDLVEHWTTLIRVLQEQGWRKRVPMMAPEPPPDFVPRPKEFEALKRHLLDAKSDSVVGVTAALRGAGGYGKTTLARALAHDLDIQDAYFDGILWVELGEKQERLLSILSDLITLLTGERPQLETINAATTKLSEALGDRRILLIIDDAWREQDLLPFLHGGPNTVRLVTTRIDSVLPETTVRQRVDAMQASEAMLLLAGGLPTNGVVQEAANFAKLADRLRQWAVLLKIVNGFLRDRIAKARQSVSDAIISANGRLDDEGLVAFDASNETARNKAVASTIGVSLNLLSEADRLRFGELGVFPEEVEIPLGIVGCLWAATGGFKASRTEDLLNRLFDLSLLLDFDLGQRVFRLHDTIREFLRDQSGKGQFVGQHRMLIAALANLPISATDGKTRLYYYIYLPYHLVAAEEREKLDALLLDPRWLKEKLEATANPQVLIADYEQYGVGEAQRLIGATARLISGICARDARQLLPQMVGRLAGAAAIAELNFVEDARQLAPRPAILPVRPGLTPPGAETARLEGHSRTVRSLCLLPDGRLASASLDNTIRLWDVTSGVETARLEGHTDGITALCLLADGRLASGSGTWAGSAPGDNTIRLWDVTTGSETACLEMQNYHVHSLCGLQDGRVASSAVFDTTIRLWDLATGVVTGCLEGHTDSVSALCLLPGGLLASGSKDDTIRLWDVATCSEIRRLEGHAMGVSSLCVLPDGRLAAGSQDIRVWDVTTGRETARLEGRPFGALCALPKGHLACGSSSNTIGVWDVTTAAEIERLEGHTRRVCCLCLLADGRLASGSEDNTIRLWDVATGARTDPLHERSGPVSPVHFLCRLPGARLASASMSDTAIRLWDMTTGAEVAGLDGHVAGVTALSLLTRGRLASGSVDGSIRVWDLGTGAETSRLEGHTSYVNAICMLRDESLVSGSSDGTIRLWDLTTGAEVARIEGHVDQVNTLCLLPDGRLASGAAGNTIRLWDVMTGTETPLGKQAGWVQALCLLPDGRLVSGGWDGTIQLWDVTDGTEVARLEGHTALVTALCLLPDKRLVSCSHDNTIRLWDMTNGHEAARIDVDAPLHAIITSSPKLIVAGDQLGRLHWLEVID